MGNVTISIDMGSVKQRLQGLQRDIPFLTAYALTKTAQDIKAAEVDTMKRVFDRPTAWTLNALQITPATKDRLVAVVGFKEFGGTPAWKYLGPEIEGGARRKKSHERALERAGILRSGEFAVPGRGVALDAYGNMPGAMITRILSSVSANPDPMSNRTTRSRGRKRKLSNAIYFVSRGRPGAPDGIYHRAGGRAVPMILFVRPPTYRSRFPFYQVAASAAQGRFEFHFWQGFNRYVRSGSASSSSLAA